MDDAARKHQALLRRRRGLRAAAACVERIFRKPLGLEERRVELEPASEGVRSLVYFVRLGGELRHVLRMVPRRGDALWLARALEIFEAHALPGPRQTGRSLSRWTRLRWGGYAFLEEHIPGEPLTPAAPPASIPGLGRAYARLHAVSSSRWGDLLAPERGPWSAEWQRWRGRLESRALPALDKTCAAEAREVIAWLDARVPASTSFSFLHGRVTPHNILLRPDGSCAIIDVERARFGPHLEELAVLEEELLEHDPGRFGPFLAGYRAAAPQLDPAAAQGAWAWHRAAARLRTARVAAERGDLEAAAEAVRRASAAAGGEADAAGRSTRRS